jgi:hypothetical protein
VSWLLSADINEISQGARRRARDHYGARDPSAIPDHYAFSSGSFNSGLIVTDDGVVLLDALESEAAGRAEREAIAATIKKPVRFLVTIIQGQYCLHRRVEDRTRKLSERRACFAVAHEKGLSTTAAGRLAGIVVDGDFILGLMTERQGCFGRL